MVRAIRRSSNLDEEKTDIRCWSMIKHWRMCSSWEKFSNDLIAKKRKRHCMWVNDKTFGNIFIFREILQWYHLDDEKWDIGCQSIIKQWLMLWCWKQFFNDLNSMKRKSTSDLRLWSNIGQYVHHEGNSSIIYSWWREKGHPMWVNHKTLANVFIVREILQWSHLDEEKKYIGRWSIIKHSRICSLWQKFFNDLISIKRKRPSDVWQRWNFRECVRRQGNS